MKISYYPGCTLKTKAKNLEDSALASLSALGFEVEEIDRWNCCGAVYSLADDDLLHQLAPVRVLIRAKQSGATKLVTLCSQCYNTLARANQLMREDSEKSKTINDFMYEEPDYEGDVEVVHMLQLLRDEIGWDKLKKQVKKPLEGLKIGPFYGCTLLRPEDVSIDSPVGATILKDFVEALGGTVANFAASEECCGSYQVLGNPEAGLERTKRVVETAQNSGVEALILSCPLCEYNIGKQQKKLDAAGKSELPVYYFSQLLAIALGLDAESCRFELNVENARAVLKERKLIAGA